MTKIVSEVLNASNYPCYWQVTAFICSIKNLHIACGYYLDEKRIAQLNQFLDERKVPKIDDKVLIQVLTHLKELELMHEQENESDEYCNE